MSVDPVDDGGDLIDFLSKSFLAASRNDHSQQSQHLSAEGLERWDDVVVPALERGVLYHYLSWDRLPGQFSSSFSCLPREVRNLLDDGCYNVGVKAIMDKCRRNINKDVPRDPLAIAAGELVKAFGCAVDEERHMSADARNVLYKDKIMRRLDHVLAHKRYDEVEALFSYQAGIVAASLYLAIPPEMKGAVDFHLLPYINSQPA